MAIPVSDNQISNVTVLRCQVCDHEWPEFCELPMDLDAFIERIKAWLVCPVCGNKSKGKAPLMLTEGLYREAVDRFVAEGRVPANIERPWVHSEEKP